MGQRLARARVLRRVPGRRRCRARPRACAPASCGGRRCPCVRKYIGYVRLYTATAVTASGRTGPPGSRTQPRRPRAPAGIPPAGNRPAAPLRRPHGRPERRPVAHVAQPRGHERAGDPEPREEHQRREDRRTDQAGGHAAGRDGRDQQTDGQDGRDRQGANRTSLAPPASAASPAGVPVAMTRPARSARARRTAAASALPRGPCRRRAASLPGRARRRPVRDRVRAVDGDGSGIGCTETDGALDGRLDLPVSRRPGGLRPPGVGISPTCHECGETV